MEVYFFKKIATLLFVINIILMFNIAKSVYPHLSNTVKYLPAQSTL